MNDADFNPRRPVPLTTNRGFNFRQAFTRQWRESVRYLGAWGALTELAQALWRSTIELLPSRRQARFGDLDYDWEHSVDTTRSNVGFRTQLLAELAGRPYFASEPWLFEQIMHAQDINFPGFTFIDLGSGKGRTLLMAASYPFQKIIGVEFMPELHLAACNNIQKHSSERQSGRRLESPCLESLCMDARDFEFPPVPLVVYLFNPFPESTFVAVIENLRQSIVKVPRPVYIAYRFTEFEELLQKCDWLEKTAGTEQWAVFRNRRECS